MGHGRRAVAARFVPAMWVTGPWGWCHAVPGCRWLWLHASRLHACCGACVGVLRTLDGLNSLSGEVLLRPHQTLAPLVNP